VAVQTAPARTDRSVARRALRILRVRLARIGRAIEATVFSSLTRRILFINLAGLAALLLGILFLNQFRAGLIDARVQSLLVQGEIIAAAVAGSAQVESGSITIDPERLLDVQPGDPNDPFSREPSYEFVLNPERIAPVLRHLVGTPARVRARIWDREGVLVLDSRFLFQPGQFRSETVPNARFDPFDWAWRRLRFLFARGDLPRYREVGVTEGRAYAEVGQAVVGRSASVVRLNDRGELIVSVAVPVQRSRQVLGAVLLSTFGGDIDAIVDGERIAILRVFLVAAAVMILLSVLMSGSIAGPVRRLAAAAERVRRGTRAREEIPDFTERQDEIGHLSGALRDMTGALYDRIEAIERFAADVAHELKNPLTSLRSAVETLPLARTDQTRERLLEVIRHDVRRLDRLITDISDASRLDAELQRERAEFVDIARTLSAVVQVQNDIRDEAEAEVQVSVTPHPLGPRAFRVEGHDVRLGQVFTNLIDNARSFSPPDRPVRVALRREGGVVEIVVDDDGPGIRVEPIERIFERFYTDRPEASFGNNSGLGLSISKQIVEAHRGAILAENRYGDDDAEGERPILGARFTVRLPAA
jgi:two-component system sensor histidine kinase ChvG